MIENFDVRKRKNDHVYELSGARLNVINARKEVANSMIERDVEVT